MSVSQLFLDKKYTVVGDAVLNAAATLNTVRAGRPRSVRVENRVLSEAFKRLKIQISRRHDSHELAEIYEGIVGFAYLKLGYTFEALSDSLISLIKSEGEEEAYTKFISQLLQELKREGVVTF